MKKFSMDEATFDKFKKLIAEGDEMDMALDGGDGKSFRDVVSAISEECGLQINNCGDSEAELGDEYMTVGLVYDDRSCCFALLSRRTRNLLVMHGVKDNEALLGLGEDDLQKLDSLSGVGEETIDGILAMQKFVKLRCQ